MSIGYACIALAVQGANFRKCTLQNASESFLNEITHSNLIALDKIIDYNIQNGIKMFRISSDIIPFGSHKVNKQRWWEDHENLLAFIGEKIKKSGMRVSMHPGQYTVLNSPDENIVARAVDDLIYHTRFLDKLGVDSTNKLILHIGGVYNDKVSAIERFKSSYLKLSEEIKARLIIENDEKNYTVNEVLDLGFQMGIPVVFDNLHHKINPSMESLKESEWIKKCRKTWRDKDGRQKIHYSQQKPNALKGAHSQTIEIKEFVDFYELVKNEEIDIMLEVKDKNLSALKCIYSVNQKLPIKYLQREWARYKYLVMSHSQQGYLEIRKAFNEEDSIEPVWFYERIEEVLSVVDDLGAEQNAALHIWGYFKNKASEKEKVKFFKYLEQYIQGKIDINLVKRNLFQLSEKYEMSLLDSYYFLME